MFTPQSTIKTQHATKKSVIPDRFLTLLFGVRFGLGMVLLVERI
jgi:hypothetical protein